METGDVWAAGVHGFGEFKIIRRELKPEFVCLLKVRAEARTLQSEIRTLSASEPWKTCLNCTGAT
jgi:hypothetical protein